MVLFFLALPARLPQLHAQDLKVQITVPSDDATHVLIAATYSPGSSRLSFLNNYGTALGLGDRIESLELSGKNGEPQGAERIAPGEFRAASPGTHFHYSVRMGQPEKAADMAHISWLANGMGYLMLADLLPRFDSTVPASHIAVDFTLPPGWGVASTIRANNGHYLVDDLDKTIFFVGKGLREKSRQVGSMELSFVTATKWRFSDDQALKIAERVVKEYDRRIAPNPNKRAAIFLSSFPAADSEPHWSAETRGSTVAIVFSEGQGGRNALAQLGILFTHELFHLWVPNGLALSGDYDWFFEGFTLYQALRTAVRLGFINFDEYLNTIGRVYQAYLSFPDRDLFSLPEASKRRFTGGSSVVYDKGMLLAFIYDLALRARSDGKLSVEDIYRALFQRPRGAPEDANQAIIAALSAPDGMKELTQSYIVDHASIELERLVSQYGLKIETSGPEKHLVVDRELNRGQSRLLRSLGFRH